MENQITAPNKDFERIKISMKIKRSLEMKSNRIDVNNFYRACLVKRGIQPESLFVNIN